MGILVVPSRLSIVSTAVSFGPHRALIVIADRLVVVCSPTTRSDVPLVAPVVGTLSLLVPIQVVERKIDPTTFVAVAVETHGMTSSTVMMLPIFLGV